MMDTRVKDESASLSTVMDYADAIQRVGSGQFTSRFRKDGQRFLASFYGAPFFALSRLAPETLAAPDSNPLIIASDSMLASDGGRWLSLYARAHRPTGKLNLTICVPTKPRSMKPPRPLLFQPALSILVKDWVKHLSVLSSPPDVLLYYPHSFDELKLATEQLSLNAAGRKVLVSCPTRLDTLIARRLLNAHGYQTDRIIGFSHSDGEPQHHAVGAWWFSAVIPSQNEAEAVDSALVDRLGTANRCLNSFLGRAKAGNDLDASTAIVAMRTTETVDGAAVNAVRTSSSTGIDLSTGRGFAVTGTQPEAGFAWDDFTIAPDLLEQVPQANAAISEDEDRLALMIWLGHAYAEEAARELQKIVEDDSVDHTESPGPLGNTGIATPEMAQAHEDCAPEQTVDASAQVPTSIRDAAGSVAPSAQPPTRPRLSRSAGTVNVLALAARLGKAGQQTDGTFDSARNKILAWLKNKGFGELHATSNQHCEQSDGELTIETDGQSIWSMRFDDRGSMNEGAIWRVEATLLGQPAPAISLRLFQVRSSEDAPPPVVGGVPQVVGDIARDVGLQDAGALLRNSALRLKGEADGDGIRLSRLLLNPHRAQSVIVIAGAIDASADRLAKRLAGVAHVVVIDSAISNHLIRTFGRELSVYGSAVRLYRPGFAPDTDQYQHRVWPLKGTQLPKWMATDIFEEACAISIDAGDLEERAPSFQTVRNHLATARRAASDKRLADLREQAESIASSKDEQIGKLQAIRNELESALAEHRNKTDELDGTAKQLQTELQSIRLERDSAREEIRQLRYQLNNQWVDEVVPESDEENDSYYPDNWDELEDWVEIYGEGKLELHPKAAKAARESPFKDIPLAYKAMEYLVRYYIPMRTRSADDNEAFERSQHALAELGLEESDVGTAKDIKRYKHEYKRQYDGSEVTLDRHLKSGVGFGGEFQFRLYFYYDDQAEKVLIGHLPTHLTNRLSHNG